MAATDIVAGVTVEIGFGVNAVGGALFVLNDPVKGALDNTTYLLAGDSVFVDVTRHVAAISISRGRAREIDEYGTGSAVVVFNDDDRTFDPAHTGSPYAGEIVPMKRIAVKWQGDGLFTGWVIDWSVEYMPGDNLSRVSALCVDGFGILANQELDQITEDHSGDLAGARISRVLDRDEVDYPASRSIDTGNATLGATSLGGNALSYLQACARAEAGYLFVAADGTLTFRNRLATLNTPADAVFSDDPAAGIPYLQVSQRSASDLLFNRVTGESSTTGTSLSAVDTSAPDRFFVRTLALGSLFNSTDAETQNLLDYHLKRFAEPEARFHTATVNAGSLSATQAGQVAVLDLTDVVTVKRLPLRGKSYDPFEPSSDGYTLDDLTLLTLDSGGYKEAA